MEGNDIDPEKSLPFTRDDSYGELGLDIHWKEWIRLIVLGICVVPLKLCGLLTCLLGYYVLIKVSEFCLTSDKLRFDVAAFFGKIYCRACLFSLGFIRIHWVSVKPEIGTRKESSFSVMNGTPSDRLSSCLCASMTSETTSAVGIVSNHCSWCDILLHMNRYFPSFVAKHNTKDMLIVGAISKAMNCIYVDRLKRNSNASNNLAQGVAAQVRQRMLDTAAGKLPGARPMLLFPEATTTNGKYLLPFKTGAFLAGCPLRPVIIQYKVNHISPCWESIRGIRHIILMMCNPIHEVTCYEFPVYYPSDEEKKDAKLYADNVRDYMLKCSGLQPSTATYEDKVEFHAAMKRKHIQTPLRDDQTLKTKSKGTHKD